MSSKRHEATPEGHDEQPFRDRQIAPEPAPPAKSESSPDYQRGIDDAVLAFRSHVESLRDEYRAGGDSARTTCMDALLKTLKS